MQLELELLRDGAIRWLQAAIPISFWENAHNRFCEIDELRRADIVRINAALGLSEKKRFLKLVSYQGAVRVPANYPKKGLWFDETCSGWAMDPGNWVYKKVFLRAWPTVTFVSNESTIGDLIEAMLGLAWAHRARNIVIPEIAREFIRLLEHAIWTEYVLINSGSSV